MIQLKKHDYYIKIGCDVSRENKQFFVIETAYFNMTNKQILNTIRGILSYLYGVVEANIKYLEVKDETGAVIHSINELVNVAEPVTKGIIKPRR